MAGLRRVGPGTPLMIPLRAEQIPAHIAFRNRMESWPVLASIKQKRPHERGQTRYFSGIVLELWMLPDMVGLLAAVLRKTPANRFVGAEFRSQRLWLVLSAKDEDSIHQIWRDFPFSQFYPISKLAIEINHQYQNSFRKPPHVRNMSPL
uniref:Uncharacterized protein n=1 Tax=mine drainage metagenome TaxID=410659 RepID=E6QI76_9ZZZZ